jgi:hypothetical protein
MPVSFPATPRRLIPCIGTGIACSRQGASGQIRHRPIAALLTSQQGGNKLRAWQQPYSSANDQRWRVTLMCRSKAPSPKKIPQGQSKPRNRDVDEM